VISCLIPTLERTTPQLERRRLVGTRNLAVLVVIMKFVSYFTTCASTWRSCPAVCVCAMPNPAAVSSPFGVGTECRVKASASGFWLHQRRRLTVLPMLATPLRSAVVSWWDVGLLFRFA
jgi:hypothetical protein